MNNDNHNLACYPFNSLYDVLPHNVKTSPNKIIIHEDDLKISNQQFKLYVDQIAKYLLTINITANDKVILIMTNCWQYIANVFAINKIGAVAVPVNNFFKTDELAYVINNSEAKIAFISNSFLADTKDLIIKTNLQKIIWVDGCTLENERNLDYNKIFQNNLLDENDKNISSGTNSSINYINKTILILYTSGTTGKPKGAKISAKNIFSNCEGAKALMRASAKQVRMICYLPMFHAFTLTATIILPIYTNGRVIIIRSIKSKNDFKKLLKILLFQRCRYFVGIPDIYSAMSRAKLPWYFHWFHSVKGFISGAAPLSDEINKRFSAAFLRGKLLQGYGITECSPVVSCNSVENNRFGSVGRALNSYQIKIVNEENMDALGTGEIGEICVKGDCVMGGYYNNEEETQKAIIDGWFKTGDIGYLDVDNYLFIVDRKKDLIINKGMNIYPREIEEILYTHEKIKSCAVIGAPDSDNSNEVPIAYIELHDGQELNESTVREFLKPHLAAFKIPRRVYFTTIPRNSTGKILKRELRKQYLESKTK